MAVALTVVLTLTHPCLHVMLTLTFGVRLHGPYPHPHAHLTFTFGVLSIAKKILSTKNRYLSEFIDEVLCRRSVVSTKRFSTKCCVDEVSCRQKFFDEMLVDEVTCRRNVVSTIIFRPTAFRQKFFDE